ncbi:cyclodeaminase/cyclohydrolase family protein [Microbacterium sp. NPDC089189]|uniref:cyclodeaminase/cyclohydrolase family protein n=1 Tax=Microbacterium sp. NPDC089189 TaxID=3154972 RepID=UPI00343F8F86
MTRPADDRSADELGPWLERLAEPVPSPGGGAAAAVTIAVGAAVLGMTAGYAAEGDERRRAIALAARVRQDALAAADRDAAASAALVAAFRLPEDERSRAVRAGALREAATASLTVARLALPLVETLGWLAEHGDPMLTPDVVVAGRTLAAGIRSACATARSNLTAAAGVDDGALAPLRTAESDARAAAGRFDAVASRVEDAL